MKQYDVIVIGGGQSGLAAAYYLRRSSLNYLNLDQEKAAGGAWQHYWDSLRLFSPAQWSSLPGTIMQGGTSYYPTRHEVVTYLQQYERKYQLQIQRPVSVLKVEKEDGNFVLHTTAGIYQTKALVSATGTFSKPYIPTIADMHIYQGLIIHSSQYKSPAPFQDQRVAVVGEGNSGAQILAEVSRVADTLWISSRPPRFLPDEVDGRYLFDAATQMYQARKHGKEFKPPSLGDIVMVPPVKEARQRGVFKSLPPFHAFSRDSLLWLEGREEKVDAVIFCTGFKPALRHLSALQLQASDGRIPTTGTRSKDIAGLWLLGYGQWTGFASATLIGVGRSAKKTVEEIQAYLAAR